MIFIFFRFAALHSFIMMDFRNRYDLAMTWLYQQFIIEESKAVRSATRRDSKYSRILTDILLDLQKFLDPRDK